MAMFRPRFRRRVGKAFTSGVRGAARKRYNWLGLDSVAASIPECTFLVATPEAPFCPALFNFQLVTPQDLKDNYAESATVVRVIGEVWIRPRFADPVDAAVAVMHTRWGAYKDLFTSLVPDGLSPDPQSGDYADVRWLYMRQRLTDVAATGTSVGGTGTGTMTFPGSIAGCCADIPGFTLELGTGIQLPSNCEPCVTDPIVATTTFTPASLGTQVTAPRFQKYSFSSKRKQPLRENEGYSVAMSMTNLHDPLGPVIQFQRADVVAAVRVLMQIG